MKPRLNVLRLAFLTCIALGLTAPAAVARQDAPPNWMGSGTGTTTPADTSPPGYLADDDTFRGKSTLVGRFQGTGSHLLNLTDFTFAGETVWTAANGDQLFTTYEGQVFPSGDPDYPFGFEATLWAVGGTGRFADAQGKALMTGGFTGIPGEFYFDIGGTIDLGSE